MNDQPVALIGRYRSPFTRRVAVSMKILGIEYQLRSRTAWQNFDEVTSLNPIGRVPILVLESGEALFDSAAILDYLDERVGPEQALAPPSGEHRRAVNQLTAIALGVIDKARELFYEKYLRPPALRHSPWMERWESQIASGLSALVARASEPWMAGLGPTQADVTAGVMIDFVRLYHPGLIVEGQYPAIDRLHNAYDSMPAFSETRPESD